MIPDLHMPGKGGNIGHNNMIADTTVMGDMAVGHNHIIIADNRFPIAVYRTPVDGNIFPNLVIVADDQLGWLLPCNGYPEEGHQCEAKEPILFCSPDGGMT